MPNFIDLTGQRFGRLVVLRRTGTSGYGQPKWACACECGQATEVFGNSLRSGKSKSCGCLQRDTASTHGASSTAEFTIWQMMLQRCGNPKHRSFSRYGGRGITVCDRWSSFEHFLADMGERPSPEHTIDRIDNDAGYSPQNCRWATPVEQGGNRSNTVNLTLGDATMDVRQWAISLGMAQSTLKNRLKNGWSVERALTEPVNRKSTRA